VQQIRGVTLVPFASSARRFRAARFFDQPNSPPNDDLVRIRDPEKKRLFLRQRVIGCGKVITKMRKYLWLSPILFLALGAAPARADILALDYTQDDDSFTSYISTANNVLGTQFTGSVNLTPGTTYYLHIVAVNNFGAAGFGADLSLTGSFEFGNETHTLNTDTGIPYWQSASASAIGSGWVTPTDQAILECNAASNAASCAGLGAGEYVPTVYSYPPGMIWDPNSAGGAYNNAEYWNGQCTQCQVELSTTIMATPEPGSLLLFGTVLLGLGGTLKRTLFS
jgi:hypothetical protein